MGPDKVTTMPLTSFVRYLGKLVARNYGTLALCLVCVGLLSLHMQQRRAIERLSEPAPAGITPDSFALGIPAKDLKGNSVLLDFAKGRASAVYVMSPFCDWCERNYENIIALAGSQKRYHFIGVATAGTIVEVQQHLAKYPLPFTTYLVDREETVDRLSLRATPTLLITNGDGRIDRFWVGALSGNRKKSVEEFFGLSLPGIAGS